MSDTCHVIDHPSEFTEGTRVLLLNGRAKDGALPRSITKISHDPASYGRALLELLSLHKSGERIYASAGQRDIRRAVRIFKERQAAADYDCNPEYFYKNIERRWTSCLMSPRAQHDADKVWLFDCDDEADYAAISVALKALSGPTVTRSYWYSTKSTTGHHLITNTFDKRLILKWPQALNCLHVNPMMLVAY